MTDTALIDLAVWREDLEVLRQNWLLSESAFLTFASERGLSVHGVLEGEPSDFHRKKWLECDEKDSVGRPLFHPFRIYPLYELLNWAALKSLPTNNTHSSQISVFEKSVRDWNEIANLAILLEPVYWPWMVGAERRSSLVSEAEYRARAADYRKKVLDVVKGLNAEIWRKAHGQLRLEAVWMDKNTELYALLRLSHWKVRENLTGKLAGALWIRHNIVGMISAHDPDFEFANFTIDELVEVAVCIDETDGFSGEGTRAADWKDIRSGGALERRYCAVSCRRGATLKGKRWGRALGTYASEHPRRPADGSERPIWRQIHAALNAWMSNYDFQRERFTFDPETFEPVTRAEP